MWKTWFLIAAGVIAALITLSLLLFSDLDCRNWQRAYTALHDINAEAKDPVDDDRILGRTINRFGARPEGCQIPELTTERVDESI